MTHVKSSYLTGPTCERLLNETIASVFDRVTEQFPDNDALIVKHQNIHWTYRQYQEQVNNFAKGLTSIGIKKGDRVGIWSPNRYEWCVTQFATAKIGAIMVCINPAYRVYELEYALNKVGCKAVVTAESFKSSAYLQMLQKLAPELNDCEPGKLMSQKLPHLNTVIRMGDETTSGMFNYQDLCDAGADLDSSLLAELQDKLSHDEIINIQFTSGTTGSPKGASLTHCNILNNGKVVGDGMKLTETDRLCIPVPLYHCFGMVMGNLACITHGSAAVFPNDAFDPLKTLETVEAEQCTALHGVPTMFIAELEHPQFSSFDLSSLRTGIMAGSPCPEPIMKKVLSDMHMSDVLIAYGQTETSPVNHMTEIDDPIEKRVGSVGRAGPHLEIKIINEQGETLDTDKPGEICCRGYAVMHSYWDDPENTQATIDRDGWLHSGDIGVMDPQGYVKVVGRIKDLIIRGGENIYPTEIESFLYSHPAIKEVQVFGVPDEKYGEQVCTWIQKLDQDLSEEEVRQFCKENITHFKVPHYIRFVDEYPMTVTGKIQKYLMREAMQKELNK